MKTALINFTDNIREHLRGLEKPQVMQLIGLILLLFSIPLLVFMTQQIQKYLSSAYIDNCDLSGGADAEKYIQVLGLVDCKATNIKLRLNLTSPFESQRRSLRLIDNLLGQIIVKEASAQTSNSPTILKISWISNDQLRSNYLVELSNFEGNLLIEGTNFTSNTIFYHSIGGSDEQRLALVALISREKVIVKPERTDPPLADFGYLKACNGTGCSGYPTSYNLNVGPYLKDIEYSDSRKLSLTIPGKGFGESGKVYHSRGGVDVKEVAASVYEESQIVVPISSNELRFGYLRVCRNATNTPSRAYSCSDFVNYDLRSASAPDTPATPPQNPPSQGGGDGGSSSLQIKDYCLEVLEDNAENRKVESIIDRHQKKKEIFVKNGICKRWPSTTSSSVQVDLNLPDINSDKILWVLFISKDGRQEYYYYRVPVVKSSAPGPTNPGPETPPPAGGVNPNPPASAQPTPSPSTPATADCKEPNPNAVANAKDGRGEVNLYIIPADYVEYFEKNKTVEAPFYRFFDSGNRLTQAVKAKLYRQDASGNFNCVADNINYNPSYQQVDDKLTIGNQPLFRSRGEIALPKIQYPDANYRIEFYSNNEALNEQLKRVGYNDIGPFKFNCSGNYCVASKFELYYFPKQYSASGVRANYHFFRIFAALNLNEVPVEIHYKNLRTIDGNTPKDSSGENLPTNIVFKNISMRKGPILLKSTQGNDGYYYFVAINQNTPIFVEDGGGTLRPRAGLYINDYPAHTVGEVSLLFADQQFNHPVKVVVSDNFRITIGSSDYGAVDK